VKVIRVLRNDLGTQVWSSGPLADPVQIKRIEGNLERSMAKDLFTIEIEDVECSPVRSRTV